MKKELIKKLEEKIKSLVEQLNEQGYDDTEEDIINRICDQIDQENNF